MTQQISTTVQAKGDFELIRQLLDEAAGPGWSEAAIGQDVADFFGVRNGRGLRQLLEEVQSLPNDLGEAAAAISAIDASGELARNPDTADGLVEHLKGYSDAMAAAMRETAD